MDIDWFQCGCVILLDNYNNANPELSGQWLFLWLWMMIKVPLACNTATQHFYTLLKYELIDFHFNKFHNWIFFYYSIAFIDSASIIIDMSIVRLDPFPSTHSFISLRRKLFFFSSYCWVCYWLIFLCGRFLSIINATREKWMLMHLKNRIKQMNMEKISKP